MAILCALCWATDSGQSILWMFITSGASFREGIKSTFLFNFILSAPHSDKKSSTRYSRLPSIWTLGSQDTGHDCMHAARVSLQTTAWLIMIKTSQAIIHYTILPWELDFSAELNSCILSLPVSFLMDSTRMLASKKRMQSSCERE